eukprot:scaffold1793_cov164-Ochromonas_danica.AAC.1
MDLNQRNWNASVDEEILLLSCWKTNNGRQTLLLQQIFAGNSIRGLTPYFPLHFLCIRVWKLNKPVSSSVLSGETAETVSTLTSSKASPSDIVFEQLATR